MALLNAQEVAKTGLNPVYGAATGGGDSVAAASKVFIHVKNGGGAPITVTVASQVNCDQGFDHDLVVSVPNGGERMIGPLEGPRLADASGLAQITYSAVGSVTVAALKIP